MNDTHQHHTHHAPKQPACTVNTVTDPVCGMKVDPKSAAGSHLHNGVTYHFCSKHCLAAFRTDPAKYLAKSALSIDPVCGMKLDPKSAAGSHLHNGTTYYFCSKHCLAAIKADPATNLANSAPVCAFASLPGVG